MRNEIVAHLLRLNREFYQNFAEPFSQSRQRLQPGVEKALDGLADGASILDLGCGNGQLARRLYRSHRAGTYTGLDSSPELLEIANQAIAHPRVSFQLSDLADPAWPDPLTGQYDQIFAFAVFHHLPSAAMRLRVLRQARTLIAAETKLILSVWDFLGSERQRERIVPWDAVGLSQDDVESGDYLMDWRRGGYGLRYVHHFSEQELDLLARDAGYEVIEGYRSDGEGGQLGIYQTWIAKN